MPLSNVFSNKGTLSGARHGTSVSPQTLLIVVEEHHHAHNEAKHQDFWSSLYRFVDRGWAKNPKLSPPASISSSRTYYSMYSWVFTSRTGEHPGALLTATTVVS